MAGQLWSAANGYMATPTLSEELRNSVQPISRFMQFADVEDAIGKNAGETFTWSVYGNTADDGGEIAENASMPETSFPVGEGSVTVKEYGNSVPFSSKYDDLSEHPVKEIIHKTLKNDASKTLDRSCHAEFDKTLLRMTSTSASAATLVDTGTAALSHTHDLGLAHVKLIADTLEERNVPTFDGENYTSIMRPSTMRPVKDELEAIHQYTESGWNRVMEGEKGRYEGIRFVTQTNIASEGKAKSDAAYFFGADTVTEAVAVPLELRGKIPDDYGRGKGIAWYALEAFGIVHADATSAETKAQARIIKWDSNL